MFFCSKFNQNMFAMTYHDSTFMFLYENPIYELTTLRLVQILKNTDTNFKQNRH